MNTGLLGGVTFVLVFAGIILLHELGHFTIARLMNIEIEEFGIGFPPRILKLFSWKGTDFTLNWIPLGGFVRMKAEDDPNVPGGLAAAKPWKRIAVLLAGASMNLITAVFVYTIFFSQIGIPDTHSAVIAVVDAGSPAEQAGLMPGDIVQYAGGEQIDGYKQLVAVTNRHLDEALPLVILRDGKTLEFTVTPRSIHAPDEGPIGIGIGQSLAPARNWFETIIPSFSAVGGDISNLLSLPGRIIAGTLSPQEAQIGGPRSIWNLFQQSVARDISSRQPDASTNSLATAPTNYTLLIIISLTVTVGVVNLLPIPALDGGRIFLTLIEIVSRRTIPAKYQAAINGTGFIILLCLLGFFYIKDIISPVAFTLP